MICREENIKNKEQPIHNKINIVFHRIQTFKFKNYNLNFSQYTLNFISKIYTLFPKILTIHKDTELPFKNIYSSSIKNTGSDRYPITFQCLLFHSLECTIWTTYNNNLSPGYIFTWKWAIYLIVMRELFQKYRSRCLHWNVCYLRYLKSLTNFVTCYM